MNSTSNNRFRDAARGLGSNTSTQKAAKSFKAHTVRSLPKGDGESSNRSQLGLAKDFKHAELSKHEDSFFKRAGGESKRSINSQSHRNSKGQIIKLSAAYVPSHPPSHSVLPGVMETDVKDKHMTPIQELFRIKTQKSPATGLRSLLDSNESKMVSERTMVVHSTSKMSNPAKKSRFGAENSPDTTRGGQQTAVTARAAALISTYESAKQMASSARKQLNNLPVLGGSVNPHLRSYLQLSQTSNNHQKTTFEQNFEDGQELFDSRGRQVAGPQEPARRQSKLKSVRDGDLLAGNRSRRDLLGPV